MERNAQLAAPGRARSGRLTLKSAFFLLFLLARSAYAQCTVDPQQATQIEQLFSQQNWTEVVRLAASLPCRSAGINFNYGMALAHLQQLPAAHDALIAGYRQSPREERFPVELAGIAFEQKRYPEAATWLRRALKLDPHDDYANNFAATVYFLRDNTNAALKYWNRVQKPYIAALSFDAHLRIHRQLLDRAFVFSPAAVLRESDFAATQARLDGLGIFPAYHITLSARPDGSFDAEFHALERNGFGSSRIQALVSTFGGAFYETIYPSYFNLGRSAINIESLFRWDSQKLRARVAISAPLHNLPQHRWSLATDERSENWTIRPSFTGTAPSLGSLKMEREAAAGSITSYRSSSFTWSLGAEFSHRSFRNINYGSALTPALAALGFQLKQTASAQDKLLDLPEHRFSLTAGASSEFGRLWSGPPRLFQKSQGSLLVHWFPQAQGDRYEAVQQLRAGHTFGAAPFDELFMLGVERDNALWLRGHIGTRDRQKGSAPLGYNYLLSNSDFYRRIYSNGLFTFQAGPLFDIGRMSAPTSGLSTQQWLFDTGVEAKLTVLGTGVVVTYGRDLRNGTNAFYGTLPH
jgi:tetratricopeptide (TPR) repeat protein